MTEAIVITPVKDSLDTTKRTIEAIVKANGNFEYIVFNDFSNDKTKSFLDEASREHKFRLIHLEEITSNPSPNYKLVLELAQKEALEKKCPLIVVESDVVVQPDTLKRLIDLSRSEVGAGIVGAITTDPDGKYNFPYTFEKVKSDKTIKTSHSLSFCCTLLAENFLHDFSFSELSDKKDWYDVHISRQSIKLGYSNYLAKGIEVLHLPHSSRPWKNLKYSNPVLYYLKKIFLNRDRI